MEKTNDRRQIHLPQPVESKILYACHFRAFCPFVVHILTLNGGDSKRLNVQKMRAKDCVEYTLAILAIVW